MSAQPYGGKRVIVGGAGNTSADIYEDLSFRRAASITMVVHKLTCVTSAAVWNTLAYGGFPEGVETAISDFKKASMPYAVMALIGKQPTVNTGDKIELPIVQTVYPFGHELF
jgi:cation diffusion facilitator CzcD-associated flavoprotein CzcO